MKLNRAETILKETKVTLKEIVKIAFNEMKENNYGMAIWQLPNSNVKHLLLSANPAPVKDLSLEDSIPGFLFAPFDRDAAPTFLEGTYIFSFTDRLLDASNEAETRSLEWVKEKVKATEHLPERKSYFTNPLQSEAITSDRKLFEENVIQALDAIERGQLEKVVLSRLKKIVLPQTFDPFTAFENLCDTYSNALISFVSIPGIGSWMGATPEVLTTVDDGKVFKTAALAGTKAFNKETEIKTILWGEKEIEEQALVSRYIVNCFKKIRVREYEEHGPRTIVAGNLVHLNTTFEIDMEAVNFPQLGTVMLKLLHPTSAVCGTPLEDALSFIKSHEAFNREHYAGYLGPVNMEKKSSQFVNLRCMQLFENHAYVYAGAGITSGSDPEKEWEETEIKMNTLLGII